MNAFWKTAPVALILLVGAGAPLAALHADGDGPPPQPAPGDPGAPPGGPGAQPGDPPPDDPKADQADDKVPFVEEVNKAIEQGSEYLLLRPYQEKQLPEIQSEAKDKTQPPAFKVPTVGIIPGYENEKDKLEGAHWGFIDSPTLYNGGTGPAYRHPAGPTALALYALLKCGEDPNNPIIKKGFQWLRAIHRRSVEWDGVEPGAKERWWTHTIVGSSYELSAMILALTAKYDTHKRTKNSQAMRKKGKLKITDVADRLWLQQMVECLVNRRGQGTASALAISRSDMEKYADYRKEANVPPVPGDLPPEAERLGWRYNTPHINLIVASKRSSESLTIGGGSTRGGNQDLSSSQLAALALFNAHLFDVNPPGAAKVWGDIVQFALEHQEKDGPEHERYDPGYKSERYGFTPKKDHCRGFMYIPGSGERAEGDATGSMTACGVSMLVMGRSVLLENKEGQAEWDKRGFGKVDPANHQNVVDTGIWDGLAWLDQHWSSFENPGGTGYHIYYLYALERTMDLLGKNLLGSHLWYTEGARRILDNQLKRTVKNPLEKSREVDVVYWNTKSTHDPFDVLDTSFALLFLKRATKDLISPPQVTGGDSAPSDNR